MSKTSISKEQEEEKTLHHSGDKGFKAVMKVKASALEYIQVLFPSLYEQIDTNDFELDDGNHINSEFSEFYTDVVYRTKLKVPIQIGKKKIKEKTITVVLLFEHKKTIESYFLLFLQLLEYIVLLWKNDIVNKRSPSVIIPIVFFQGKKGLKSKFLHECFEGIPKELLEYIPNFRFHLTNVHKLTDVDILHLDEKGLLRSLLLAYTYTERKEKITNLMIEIFKFIKYDPEKFDFFKLLFAFIAKEDYLSADEVEELFEHYKSQNIKENIMTTTYQSWVNKGLQEGREKGIVEGREKGREEGREEGEIKKARRTVLRGRCRGLSMDVLADLSELPLVEVKKLIKGYDQVYALWSSKQVVKTAEHLTPTEINYLIDLFNKNQN
jgi:hypothetical protein